MASSIQASLQSSLNELEALRKEVSKQQIRSYATIIAGIVIVAIGIINNALFIPCAIAGIITLIVGFVFISKSGAKFNKYRHEYKHKVIAAVLKSIDQSLELAYHTGLSERDFVNSQLFSQRPDRYKSEDQIYGIADKTKFSFSEVHAEYKTVTQTKNGRREHWHTIIRGIVFCADFNKNFKGLTIVRPKGMGAALSAWISQNVPIFSSGTTDVVRLENPEFSKTFITHSTDQIEARYILTPALMERICELNERTNDTISISFINSNLFLAFPLSKNYFEPPVFKSLLKPSFLEEDLSVIRFMYGIIHELDLNTRIWGKA